MPRPSYEEHRARKRRGSFESETDAGSLASFTTHQSSSSFQPTYAYASSSRLTVPKLRTMSSTSASSFGSPILHAPVPVRPQYPSRLSGPDEATLKRREARRIRREERERKSTLRGEEYDTRLRKIVRWISKKEWRGRGVALAVALWMLTRMITERHRLRHHLTLHRYRLQRAAQHLPLTSISTTVVNLSERKLLAILLLANVALESLTWWVAVGKWVRLHGTATGRSWRSQIIAITSMILAPAFFSSDPDRLCSFQISLGSAASGLHFLTEGADQTATIALIMAAILDSRWTLFLPVAFAYLSARCASRGVREGCLAIFRTFVVPLSAHFVLFEIVNGRFQTQLPSDGSFWGVWLRDIWHLKRNICETPVPSLWCATNVILRWTSWSSFSSIRTLAFSLITLSLALILGVLAYATYRTKPNPNREIQPGASLLPIALFTSSLTTILLLPRSSLEMLVVPLLPLSMMSCMRGGKDDLGDGGEWEWTVLLHSVVTYYLAATGRAGARSLAIPALGVWKFLLRKTNAQGLPLTSRSFTDIVTTLCMFLCVMTYFTDLPPMPYWEEIWSALVFAVLVAAWLWGMSRMYLTAWAAGGLGSGPVTF